MHTETFHAEDHRQRTDLILVTKGRSVDTMWEWSATWRFAMSPQADNSQELPDALQSQPSSGLTSNNVKLDLVISALSHRGQPPKSTGNAPPLTNRKRTGSARAEDIIPMPVMLAVYVFVLAFPYAVIDRLTGFHGNESTKSQRRWMMAWLDGSNAATFNRSSDSQVS